MDWMDAMGMGSALGGGLGSLFGGDPAKKAMGEMRNIPGYFHEALDPYMAEGKRDLGTLHDQFSNLMSDPAGFYARMGAGYKQSPGYQYQLQQGLDAANRAAAASGHLGGGQNLLQLQKVGQGLANQDYGNYMRNIMGLYGQGLHGLSGLEGQGFRAGEDYAGGMANYARSMADLAAQREKNKQAMSSGIGSFLGAGAGALSSFFL